MKYLLLTAFVGMLAVGEANAYTSHSAYIAHHHYYYGFAYPFAHPDVGAGITRPIHPLEVDKVRLQAVHPEALSCGGYSSCY